MAKIAMKTPLVEMDGDEMTRVVWQDKRYTYFAVRGLKDGILRPRLKAQ